MIPCLNPACNAPNAPSAKFCMKCGTKLIIQDRYKPLRELGNGTFGKTFLAVDIGKPSQPQCVIKQFIFTSSNPSIVQKAKELFYEEAKQLEKLGKHPQIPQLFSYCEQKIPEQENRKEETFLCLIQEFIDGKNLLAELDQDGAFSEEKVRQVLVDLLPVLEFIHSHQVIHRDIKPENIMRRRSDQKLVLIDFGAVKQTTATSLQRTGTTIGSPAYRSQEQAMGKATFSSDLYSLGVSCLQLLTNMEPGDLYDVHEGEFVWRNYLLNKKVQDSLGKVLDQMTQGVVRNRYKSAQEVLQALNPPAPKIIIPATPKVSTPIPTTPIIQTPIVAGKNFTENLGNGVRLEMIAIPGGNFRMGSNDSPSEQPIHKVSIKPFYLGKYPVTQEQYVAIVGTNPSRFPGWDSPVECVSWYDATNFCQKISKKTGNNYRLPSEAEWEYACRARTQTKYYFGNNNSFWGANLNKYAWYSSDETMTVGRMLPNQFGLYDMHGNVWEWCSDYWNSDYIDAPTDGSSWENRGDYYQRVIRGGSYRRFFGGRDEDESVIDVDNCRSARRSSREIGKAYVDLGFRVALAFV